MEVNRTLFVDHDHETGVVRGLLCIVCNRNLGWYEKNMMRICEYIDDLHVTLTKKKEV